MTTVLFWDIDGTLLSTGRAGIIAFERALLELFGVTFDLAAYPTAGLTDHEIGYRVLGEASVEPCPSNVASLLRRYEDHLPECLPLRAGQVLPGVVELLTDLAPRSEFLSVLLTGNTRRGAAAKLGHYRLAHFFRDGAFSDDAPDRAGIARIALERVRECVAPLHPNDAFVIGDTPHDIRCGHAISVRTIALATGPYKRDRLEGLDAWRILDRLPDPEGFRELIREGRA